MNDDLKELMARSIEEHRRVGAMTCDECAMADDCLLLWLHQNPEASDSDVMYNAIESVADHVIGIRMGLTVAAHATMDAAARENCMEYYEIVQQLTVALALWYMQTAAGLVCDENEDPLPDVFVNYLAHLMEDRDGG